MARVPDPGTLGELAQEVTSVLGADCLLALAVKQVRAKVEKQTWVAYWQTVYEDRPPQEVADRLGLRVGSVYQAKSRVNKMLEEALRELQAREAAGEEPAP